MHVPAALLVASVFFVISPICPISLLRAATAVLPFFKGEANGESHSASMTRDFLILKIL